MENDTNLENDTTTPGQVIKAVAGLTIGAIAIHQLGRAVKRRLAERKSQSTDKDN